MLISVTIQDKDPQGNWQSRNIFITKLLPGTRRQDLVGMRGRRDMDSINFIADDLYLVKFRSSDFSGTWDYWSVIDKFGQIRRIPRAAREQLVWSS